MRACWMTSSIGWLYKTHQSGYIPHPAGLSAVHFREPHNKNRKWLNQMWQAAQQQMCQCRDEAAHPCVMHTAHLVTVATRKKRFYSEGLIFREHGWHSQALGLICPPMQVETLLFLYISYSATCFEACRKQKHWNIKDNDTELMKRRKGVSEQDKGVSGQ